MKRRSLAATGSVGLLLLAMGLVVGPVSPVVAQPDLNWSTETVDSGQVPPLWGMDLALDNSANPHIVYFSGDLYYAYQSGSTWYINDIHSSSTYRHHHR